MKERKRDGGCRITLKVFYLSIYSNKFCFSLCIIYIYLYILYLYFNEFFWRIETVGYKPTFPFFGKKPTFPTYPYFLLLNLSYICYFSFVHLDTLATSRKNFFLLSSRHFICLEQYFLFVINISHSVFAPIHWSFNLNGFLDELYFQDIFKGPPLKSKMSS